MEPISAIQLLKITYCLAHSCIFLSLLGFIVVFFGREDSGAFDHGIIPAFLLRLGTSIICLNSLYSIISYSEPTLKDVIFNCSLATFSIWLFLENYCQTFKLKYKIKKKKWI